MNTEIKPNSYPVSGDTNQTIVIQTEPPPATNSFGAAGFILAVLAIVFSWLPFVNFILWILGLIFSFVGIFKQPRGLAVAGFVLSMMGIILICVLVCGIVDGFSRVLWDLLADL